MICRQRQRFYVGLRTIPEGEVVQFLVRENAPSSYDRMNGKDQHQIVNQSRSQYNLKPLHRSAALDALALAHAQCMAQRQVVFHSVNSVAALQQKLCSHHVGENVQRGTSIQQIHHDCMSDPAQEDSFIRRNVLSTSFDEMGMGTAFGRDGIMYLCQVFRSSNESSAIDMQHRHD
jgi:uncharacterized protein YkwD